MNFSLSQHLLLALFWILWCGLHSLLITPSVSRFFNEWLGEGFRYYRLVYVVIAIATIIPVLIYRFSLPTSPLFEWQGYLRVVQVLMIGAALSLFLGGVRHYDLLQFLGIRQVREGDGRGGIGDRGGLKTGGVLGMIRHPWYLGGILILWARPVDSATLVTNLVLTAYLIVGALLEERKLVMHFGEAYRHYQQDVSMLFFPLKWLRKKIRNFRRSG